ncbi:MAG: hypothetical protein J3R72DRAFT_254902 [Linnemannia gamsii]|nr:MAG: hypothetical protein J3R72DRAFT_254902 [Linnemannia gamsii]
MTNVLMLSSILLVFLCFLVQLSYENYANILHLHHSHPGHFQHLHSPSPHSPLLSPGKKKKEKPSCKTTTRVIGYEQERGGKKTTLCDCVREWTVELSLLLSLFLFTLVFNRVHSFR